MTRSNDRAHRLLVTGVRRRGEREYRLRIFGPAASRFPPLHVRMTLDELRRWLHQLRRVPEPQDRASPLRIVG